MATSVRPPRVANIFEDDTWGRHTVYDAVDHRDSVHITEPQDNIDVPSKNLLDSMRPSTMASRFTLDALSTHSMAFITSSPLSEDIDCNLSLFESSLFATVLEDTIIQLKILDSCNTEMRTRRTLNDMERLLNIKFGVETAEAPRDELQGIDPTKLRCDQYKLVKLQKDRDCFEGLVSQTYEELTLQQSFKTLRQSLLAMVAEKDVMAFVIQDEVQNRIKRRELARQLRQQRVLNQSQKSEVDTAIDILETNVEDVALNGDIRARYVRRWQSARDEQHNWQLHDLEAVPGDRIELLKQGADNEQRVHTELEALIAVDIDETLQKIDNWMNKYDHDMEKIDLDIQFKKNDYQNMLERRVWLEKTIEEHDVAMVAWKEFKAAREKERQYREKMHTSARCVQAWWRGLLVRKQLGPYRPPKKPKFKPK